MQLYRLRILLTILLDCNMIPMILFFMPSKRTQNWFATTRQILDVLFILIFISTYIYTYFLILTYIYLFILLFSLYYYMNLMKLLKWGSKETTTKFSRLKSIFSIEDNYPFTLVICLFSSLFTITKEVNHPLLWRKCSLKLNLKKSEFFRLFSAFSLQL